MINFWSDVYKIIAECDKNVSFLEEKMFFFLKKSFVQVFQKTLGTFFFAL